MYKDMAKWTFWSIAITIDILIGAFQVQGIVKTTFALGVILIFAVETRLECQKL